MHFFLSSFGLHNPYISGKIPDHGIYPVATEMADGLDLDYTSLLLGQNYVIDKTAFEDICSGRRPFLNRMAETLKFLQREEILLVRDLRPIAKSYMRQLKNKTKAMLADPLEWLPEARAQWHAVGPYMKEFQIKFGKPDDAIINTAHFGVYSYLQQRDGAVNQGELDRITKLFSTHRQRLRASEEEDIRGSLRPLIAQVMLNELFRTKLGRPFLDWDDAKPFYDRLYLGQWDEAEEEAHIHTAAKKLLDLTIPELRPHNIESVVAFIRDEKSVASFPSGVGRPSVQ